MTQPKTPPIPKTKAQAREERLKAALKANMGRRKAQARGRAAANTDPKGAIEESE
ncbi:hypothetical protein HKX54_15910 [Sulfitobacter sp. M57]|uniref:hypothetical protein n=1 Tax=unclassified Sulfitobacter TaxID=196795 RepID=UPI0023E2C68D|nr:MULTISPECIES: hypothetical protein [unclassified Sulfitobacter]MDF3415955.1 hypothetical protein [Sulfitobacter sp. KE5]MDF3423435.1 hypothetical protein [Sulfitobacter sp. KE43]MDF3434501.1 hypothetical protein [Sulfitobacter sp. KE42]MDF3460141.1 hypothetical protein [Sulfitobacter sp. S74]MDF3464039.1 hypothetical protein [Sulfitobacter sp. Ks18]